MATQAGGQLDAVQLRHADIGDHQVRDALVDHLERFDSVAGFTHPITGAL